MYHRPGANTLQAFVRDPNERMADGIFLGLQHTDRDDRRSRPPRLQDPDRLLQERRLAVADDAAHGFGRAFSASDHRPDGHAVRHVRRRDRARATAATASSSRSRSRSAPTCQQDADGKITGNITLRRQPTSPPRRRTCSTTTAPSSARTTGRGVRSPATGASTSSTSPKAPPAGSLFLHGHDVGRPGPVHRPRHARVRAVVRTSTSCSGSPLPIGAPYILDTVGGEPERVPRLAASGRSTRPRAAPRSSSPAPAQEGPARDRPAPGRLRRRQVRRPVRDPRRRRERLADGGRAVDRAPTPGAFDVTFKATLDLPALTADGLRPQPARDVDRDGAAGRPERPDHGEREEDRCDQPRLAGDLRDATSAGNDIDLYVLTATATDFRVEIIGSPDGAAATSAVELVLPAGRRLPGVGARLRAWPAPRRSTLTIDIVQGTDLTVSGSRPARCRQARRSRSTSTYAKAMTSGQDYFGELLLGPPTAPRRCPCRSRSTATRRRSGEGGASGPLPLLTPAS